MIVQREANAKHINVKYIIIQREANAKHINIKYMIIEREANARHTKGKCDYNEKKKQVILCL